MSPNKRELPVVTSGHFEGIVRIEKLAAAVSDGFPDAPVGQLCDRSVKRIRFSDPLAAAIEHLQGSPFATLPVVDESGHLEGIVTRDSIIAAQRFGAVLRSLAAVPLRERPDELRQHLTRMQIG